MRSDSHDSSAGEMPCDIGRWEGYCTRVTLAADLVDTCHREVIVSEDFAGTFNSDLCFVKRCRSS